MADAYTGTGSVAWDQTAYNRLLYFAFRENNTFDQIADVKPTNQTNPGATVTFFKVNELAPVNTALSEALDVDAVALSDSTVNVALYEYGNAVIETQLLRLTSMIATDPAIADLLGANSAESMDLIAAAALALGTNVKYAGSGNTARNQVDATSVLTAADFRYARNRLRRAKVPKKDGMYNAHLDPDVVHDLYVETGGLGWTELHKYTESGAQMIYNDEIGRFMGFRVIESINGPKFPDAGNGSGAAGTIDVYRSLFTGAQALAKAFSSVDGYGPNPITVMSPVVDKLQRFTGWGWKHFVGYKLFRQESVFAIESASSVGANA